MLVSAYSYTYFALGPEFFSEIVRHSSHPAHIYYYNADRALAERSFGRITTLQIEYNPEKMP